MPEVRKEASKGTVVVPPGASRRISSERHYEIKRLSLLQGLLTIIDDSLERITAPPLRNSVLMASRATEHERIDFDRVWHHWRLTEPTPDQEFHAGYMLRSDGMITRIVVLDFSKPFTGLVDLHKLTPAEIGMLMSAANTLANTR